MSKRTTIAVSSNTHKLLRRLGFKGETYNETVKRLIAIAQKQRELTELFKKGVWKASEHEAPEGISTRDYERRQLEILNELEKLASEPLSKFTKDENGRWILTQQKE